MIQVDLKKEDWDRQTFTWQDKPFYKVPYASVLGIPLSKTIGVKQAVDRIGRQMPGKPVVLTTSDSMFSGELLIELQNAENVNAQYLNGTYFSMIFEGKPRIADWCTMITQVCEQKGQEVQEILPYYANNIQTVLLAKIS